jgi:outer membrane receptor for ferrienterochelin and colicins
MKGVNIVFAMLLAANNIHAQHSFKAVIKGKENKQPLPAATVLAKGLNKTVIADSTGLVLIKNIPAGKQVLVFSYVGYEDKTMAFVFPVASDTLIEIDLEEMEDQSQEVIVSSTRTSRSIANTPTRIETISGEELDEKNNMRPANVSMLLHESTGLQVQQTSAVSGNASIRVQGLDGRYTQLLKDGYPNFGNFAGGLSILEIPPLDLKQVEIIKGPASTLYGGGAIAGVVNFISKMPKEKPEYNFMLNQSNIGQTNAGVYAAQKKGKFGYSLLGVVNFQKAYDVDKDDFSELPKSANFTVSPRLFYYPDATVTIMLGNSFSKGTNTGGDMHVISGHAANNHVYFEKNNTIRNTSTLELDKKFDGKNSVKFKQSLSFFDRKISIPNYIFRGFSTNSFSDLSYIVNRAFHTIISGINLVFDKFTENKTTSAGNQNAQSFTAGMYIQDTWDITGSIKLETGVRLDDANYKNIHFNKSQLFFLPRVSALLKISDKISSRVGGGLGYKIPTIFTEQTETLQYQNVLPLESVTAERSAGATADVNYRTSIADDWQFSLNQLFFYTQIQKPLVLQKNGAGNYFFSNADNPVQSRGFETNIRLVFQKDLKFFLGYTYTNAKAGYLTGNQYLPLLPKNKLNLAAVYEKEGNFKIAWEAYFTDRQYLYNGIQTPSFWELGAMAEKTFGKISLFVNFENITDQRQSRYKTVVNPPYNRPGFDDIWNHQEGFVVNGGIKIKL